MRTILTLVNIQEMKNIVLPLGVSKSEQFRQAQRMGLTISRTSFWRIINQKKIQCLGWELHRTYEFTDDYEFISARIKAMGFGSTANHLRSNCTALFDIGSLEIQLNLDLSARVIVHHLHGENRTDSWVAKELGLLPKSQTPKGLIVWDIPLSLLMQNLQKRKPRIMPIFMGF